MKVYVINLERSVERREIMSEKMAKAGVEFEFFNAVDASIENFIMSERAVPEVTKRRKGYALLPSEVACYASHYLLWEKCVELNEPIVVLEDNIDLVEGVNDVLSELRKFSSKYSYIKLSATLKGRRFTPIERVSEQYRVGIYNRGTSGATGYILSPIAARAFISYSESFVFPCDDLMEKPWLHHIQAYSVYPSLCWRAKIASTIGNNRKDKSDLNLIDKLTIEMFRFYESVMKKIHWKK